MSSSRSLLQTFRRLSPRQQIFIGLTGMGIAVLGLSVSDAMEDRYPATSSQSETGIIKDDAQMIVEEDKGSN